MRVRTSRKVKQPKGEKALVRFATQGYRINYRPGTVNHCPGCSKTSWWVSRMTAECAHCGTALDIEGATKTAAPRHIGYAPKAEDFILDRRHDRIQPFHPVRGIHKLIERFVG